MRKIVLYFFLLFYSGLSAQDTIAWQYVSHGIRFAVPEESQDRDILICFAGWSVEQAWSENWAMKLWEAKLKDTGTGYLYAVKGPKDVFFESSEIATDSLAMHLQSLMTKNKEMGPIKIIVVAHSSGSFVAHRFFSVLNAKLDWQDLLAKITYYNLDGAIGSATPATTLTKSVSDKLKEIYAVYAYDETENIASPNKNEMQKMVLLYPEKVTAIELKSSNSGCKDPWCVHDLLINQSPHNPNGFDLEKDYFEINEQHPVNDHYFR
ncbi:MAG: hypothetical protein U5K51_04205 [Flavobacteriaceae bacterium]|nr:hypothetical protein [Flavobacteriaceae bacterium]